jgi:aspartate dehydrogenase
MSAIEGLARKKRVGFVGYGFLGKSLVDLVLQNKEAQEIMELAFVCDLGTPANVMNSPSLPESCKASSLEDWERFEADLIVEVAHPSVSTNWGAKFLAKADYMLASTTCFADRATEELLKAAANGPSGKGIYMCAGALFGSSDIQAMADMGKLTALRIVMKKHPMSLYPQEGTEQFTLNEQAKSMESGEVILFDGSVRELAPLFPRNVNTICTAAICAWGSLGMDGSTACVIADSSLEKMVINVHLEGPKHPTLGTCLEIDINRSSPAPKSSAVTSQATVVSFLSSLLKVASMPSKGSGLHLC